MNAILINITLVIMEIISFIIVAPRFKKKLFIYYTMLSNISVGISSLALLLLGRSSAIAIALRYNASCMLVLTCIVANFVLIPMGEGVRGMLWKDCGLIFHLIAPVLSLISYELFENHVAEIGVLIPLVVTIIYEIIIVWLIYLEKIESPYPFMEIRKQSIFASIMWTCIILGAVAVIGFLV